MKMLSFVFAVMATHVAAEAMKPVLSIEAMKPNRSLCELDDNTLLLEIMQGDWVERGAISIESETLSVTEPVDGEMYIFATLIQSNAVFGTYQFDQANLRRGQVYDVDQVDDLLETAEVEWIADEVSLTPCGPDGLPQVSADLFELSVDEGPIADRDVVGRVTVLPYFANKMVILVEAELRGDWGIAYLTAATLMTRE